MPLFLLVAAVVYLLYKAGSENGQAYGEQYSASASTSDPMDNFTDAWAQYEGYYKNGAPAQRYNNPMNVKGDWPGVVDHSPSGIAIFGDVGDGWDAGASWVRRQVRQHPDWTFAQVFGKVLGDLSGADVNNQEGNSRRQAQFVADYIGVPIDTRLGDFFQELTQ